MNIGAVAKATGVPAKTIRYYEGEGLLPPPKRTQSGYREYASADSERLLFIKKARTLGLSLKEVKSILLLHDGRAPTCFHVRSLLETKLVQIEETMQHLRAFQAEIERLRDSAGELEDCRPSGGRICGIIEDAAIDKVVFDVGQGKGRSPRKQPIHSSTEV